MLLAVTPPPAMIWSFPLAAATIFRIVSFPSITVLHYGTSHRYRLLLPKSECGRHPTQYNPTWYEINDTHFRGLDRINGHIDGSVKCHTT